MNKKTVIAVTDTPFPPQPSGFVTPPEIDIFGLWKQKQNNRKSI